MTRHYEIKKEIIHDVNDTTHKATIQTALTRLTKFVGDYRLAPRCNLDLRYSMTLRRVGQQLLIDISVQPM